MGQLAGQERITKEEHQQFRDLLQTLENLTAVSFAKEPGFLTRYGIGDEDLEKVAPYMDPTSVERALREPTGGYSEGDAAVPIESLRARSIAPVGERPDIHSPLETITALARVLEIMPADERAWFPGLPSFDGVTDYFARATSRAASAMHRLLQAWDARQPEGAGGRIGGAQISWDGGRMSLQDVSARRPPRADFRYAHDSTAAEKWQQQLNNSAVHPDVYPELERVKKQAQPTSRRGSTALRRRAGRTG